MTELPEIDLFPRGDGHFGVRNHVAVIATVICANAVVERLDRDELDLALITHQHGCAQVGDDLSLTKAVLAGVACNPNVGAVLLVSLGCESNAPQAIAEQVAATGRPCEIFGITGYGGVSATYDAVSRAAQRHAEDLARQPRERVAFRELVIGLECGGSDAWSGITANPALGRAADRLVDAGATVVLAETPEIIGGEHLLADRAIDPSVAERLLTAVDFNPGHIYQLAPPYRSRAGRPLAGPKSIAKTLLPCLSGFSFRFLPAETFRCGADCFAPTGRFVGKNTVEGLFSTAGPTPAAANRSIVTFLSTLRVLGHAYR